MNRRNGITTLALLASLAVTLPGWAQQGPPPQGPPQQGPPQQGPPQQGAPPRAGQGGPAQGGPPQGGPGQGGPAQFGPAPRGAQGGPDGRPGNPSADMHMPPGRWWDDPGIAQTVGLNADQVKKMDDIFNGARDHLIDLDAAVQKAEGGLQPLIESDPIDGGKIMSQIERLMQAKAELEKANAQMLVNIRMQLTHDQWVKLEGIRPPRPPGR
jgi:Spy/CpxP family protein refolding chaperone